MGNIMSDATIAGGGGFGFGGSWGIPPVGLFGISNIFGGGYGGYAGGGAVAAGAELRSEILQQTIANLQASNTCTNTVTAAVGEAAEGIGNKLESLNQSVYAGFTNLSNQVQQAKYDAAISNCQQTNYIVGAINNGIQSIKDQLCDNKIADLERALSVAENGGPIVRSGAFVPVNPCSDNSRMTNIENTIIQIGNRLNAMQVAAAK